MKDFWDQVLNFCQLTTKQIGDQLLKDSGKIQASKKEDGIRDLVRSRGLGDVYKRQAPQIAIRIDFIRRSSKNNFERLNCFLF